VLSHLIEPAPHHPAALIIDEYPAGRIEHIDFIVRPDRHPARAQQREGITTILTAPGEIKTETAQRLKEHWEEHYSGKNAGKVAVLGDGLKFEPMRMTSSDAQVIEQLKWTAEVVCAVFHVPPYKIGIGQQPTHNNIQALNVEYYSQALQVHIESAELVLDEGLALPEIQTTRFDLDDLLRMDTATKVKTAADGIIGGLFAPNEQRIKFDLRPVEGGETPYLQQQNYSLGALARRDAAEAERHEDVQAEALNGAQITALQGLVLAASQGEIPIETVEAVIAAAFPLLSPAEIAAIVAPLKVTPPPAPASDGEDTADDVGDARAFADLVCTKAEQHVLEDA
jgi:hypothetical protein